MTRINLETIKNEDSFSPEYRELEFKADKQIIDTWGDEEIDQYNFKVTANSLTELYQSLYDTSQSNDCFPNDAKLFIEDELFAEMVGGIHLKLNEKFSQKVAEKYMTEHEIDFVTSNVLRKTYAENEVVDGITLYRDDGLKAYQRLDAGNHIVNEKGRNVFKDKEEALDALKYYVTQDGNADCLNNLDRIKVTLDGQDIVTLSFGKELEKKIEEPRQERRSKRGLR